MRFFWLVIVLIGAVLLLFWWREALATAITSDQLANASYLGIIALLITSSVLASGIRIGELVRHCLIWFSIIMVLLLGYNHRYQLQDMGSTLSAGLIPSSPLARYDAADVSVTLRRGSNGHFETRALVNGVEMRFMLDTGASRVVLSHVDARRIGVDINDLHYSVTTSTANGLAQAAPIRLQSINIGGIERKNIAALIAQPGAMSGSLLGMSFLNSLSGYAVRADQLTLVD